MVRIPVLSRKIRKRRQHCAAQSDDEIFPLDSTRAIDPIFLLPGGTAG
jgi:hypothetical protein